jgi:hypothetical protein
MTRHPSREPPMSEEPIPPLSTTLYSLDDTLAMYVDGVQNTRRVRVPAAHVARARQGRGRSRDERSSSRR